MGERIVTLRLSDEDGLLLERTARECGILAKNTLGMPEPAGSMAGLVKALIRAERHRRGTLRDVLVEAKVVVRFKDPAGNEGYRLVPEDPTRASALMADIAHCEAGRLPIDYVGAGRARLLRMAIAVEDALQVRDATAMEAPGQFSYPALGGDDVAGHSTDDATAPRGVDKNHK